MTSKPLLLSLLRNPAASRLDDLGDSYDLRPAPAAGITAVVTGPTEGIDAATIDALPDLRTIVVCGVGYDAVDIAHARARGIAVTNTPDVLTDDVADLAIALMLSVARRVPTYDRYVRDGRWPAEGPPPLARRLSGRRIGIVGLGRIGRTIADRLVPFGGEIAYFARSARPDAPWRHEPDLVALAAWSQVLVVAVAGGSGTAGLIDSATIEALGPDGILINIARGSVIDEPALVDALVTGRLGGAGLDVFAHEPNVPAALLSLDNVVLQPHLGSATMETRAVMAQLSRDNLAAHFAGLPLVTPVV